MAIPVHQQQSCDVMFMFGCHHMVTYQSQRSFPIWARWTYGWWHRCEDDPKSSPPENWKRPPGRPHMA